VRQALDGLGARRSWHRRVDEGHRSEIDSEVAVRVADALQHRSDGRGGAEEERAGDPIDDHARILPGRLVIGFARLVVGNIVFGHQRHMRFERALATIISPERRATPGCPAYEAVTGCFDHTEHEVQYQARAGPVKNFARDEARDQPQNDPADTPMRKPPYLSPLSPTRLNTAQSITGTTGRAGV
jgi:hypothetical protein